MRKISDLTTPLQAKSQGPSRSATSGGAEKPLVLAARAALAIPSTANINESHIDRLWHRMSAIFGHKWTSSYGAEPSDTWLAGLVDMSDEELRTGLVACLSWGEEWPPTLPQFRSLCRHRREEAHQLYVRALPEPAEAKAKRMERGLSEIGGIRESMRLAGWLEANRHRRESADAWLFRNIKAVVA